MKLSAIVCTLSLTTLALTGCKDDVAAPATTGKFTLHMDNGAFVTTANGRTFNSLVLGTGAYKNANGDDFTVSTFRYYISNVTLLKSDNSSYSVPDSYYLIDHADPATQDIDIKDVPLGDYTGIRFTFGVDSARSKAGNFTGVLSSSKGLLWTMNGGPEFINLEMKGYSPQNTRPGSGLLFHIAGYMQSTTNTIRTVVLPFPAANAPMLVRADHSPEVHMYADITKMFGAPNPVQFATTYSIMGGIPAARIADNIAAGMFSVGHIHAN